MGWLEGRLATISGKLHALENAPPGSAAWGSIAGTLAAQVDLVGALSAKENVAAKGLAGGYASLGPDGKVPATQVPASQGGAAWGGITGTLAEQTDLGEALAGKSPASHSHAGVYSPVAHDHVGDYAAIGHGHAQLHDRQHGIAAVADHSFPGGETFLRADGVFAAPGGGGSPAGVFSDLQISVLQSDGTLNAASGVQTWCGTNKTAQDVFTLVANSTYRFRAQLIYNTGATTHTTAFAFSFGGTVSLLQYMALLWSAAANAIATAQSTVHVSGIASKVLNATSTAVYTIIKLEGIFVVGASGGACTPQVNFSANPTGTNLLKAGSYFAFERLGANTLASVGGWA